MIVFICFTNVRLDGIEYTEFLYCFPSRIFNSRVSVLWLVMFDFNGMCQSLATGYCQPLNTAASDISI